MKRVFLKSIFSFWCLLIVMVVFFTIPSQAIPPASEPTYEGIDVSAWQGYIDYTRVKEAGIEFVYIKASEGQNYVDPYFRTNYNNAKANGLKIGFYHYVRATTQDEAIREANHFASVISGTEANCRLAMDFESFGNLSVEQINQIALTFLRTVQQITGKEMVVYSNTYTARTVFSQEVANNYPLWVANYGVQEPGENGKWDTWIGFQYTDTGEIPGIEGYVDRDYFTKEILLSDQSEIPSGDKPDDNGQKTITYTVKRGDTLSRIALYYGTTVSAIVAINDIPNPNLIYPGQQIVIPVSEEEENTGSSQTIYIVQRGDNLTRIARRYGVTVNEIVRANAISNPNLIYPNQRLIIPTNGSNSNTRYTIYMVGRGDNLSRIALRYHTTVNEIVRANNISNPNLIYPGQRLWIPINTGNVYVVKRGDTLSRVARYYRTSVKAIVTANAISNPNLIYPGQRLWIPKQNQNVRSTMETKTEERCDLGHVIYTVQQADTLEKIATLFHCSEEKIKQLNRLTSNEVIPGTQLRICCFHET